MSDTTSVSRLNIARLILVPSLISLAITLLRLAGELLQWSPTLFNREAGGGGAIIGISWLVPILGIYFALKLSAAGQGPASLGRAFGYTIAGFVIASAGVFVAVSPQITIPGKEIIALLLLVLGSIAVLPGWSALFKVLLAYGFAARIPVAILMFFAIRGQWGTHYDVLPPGFPPDQGFWSTYIQIGLVPQLVFWIGFTILVGSLFGNIAVAIVRRRKPAAAPAQA